jgi:hypothetical protein
MNRYNRNDQAEPKDFDRYGRHAKEALCSMWTRTNSFKQEALDKLYKDKRKGNRGELQFHWIVSRANESRPT